MPPAPLPSNEASRLAALRSHEILDTACEAAFDDLTRLAAQLLDAPIALVSLVDAERQWFKSRFGLDVAETPREQAFCAHAILDPGQQLVVPDASIDARFADNPLVTGSPGIRAYAGAPLTTAEGEALGTLCVIDTRPRRFTAAQLDMLRGLARAAEATMALRRAVRMRDAARAQLDLLLGAMPGVLLEFAPAPDAGGYRVVYASPSVERLIGWTAEEALQPGWWESLTEDAPAARIGSLLPALATCGEASVTLAFRCRYALPRQARVTLRWIGPPEDGRIAAYFDDVTERQRARERLQLLAQASYLSDAAVGFSHEINQPLAIISLGLENLQRSLGRLLPGETALQGRMQRLMEQAHRVGRLTEQFRGLSTAAGMRREPVDVAAEVQIAAQKVVEVAERDGVRIRLDLPGDLPPALGHPLSLRQALVELLGAALAAYREQPAGPARRVVTLAARPAGGEVVISVCDGAGTVPEPLLGQVFVPFMPIRTQAPAGGLGLAKCWHAVVAMEGRIVAANRDGGLRFDLALPLAGAGATTTERPALAGA